MTPFKLDTEMQGNGALVRLEGELDVSSAPGLRDEVVRLISEGRNSLVFNCERLGFVDSTGLGVLIGARARCLAANGGVTLVGVKPALQRLLAVTGVEALFLTAA